MAAYDVTLSKIGRFVSQIQIGRSAGKQEDSQSRMSMSSQDGDTSHPGSTINAQYKNKANQYRSHKPHLRPPTAQWHNTIGKLNPGGHREAGHCHRPTGHTPNCHQAIRPYGGRIPTCPTGVRFHIQQESDIPASTQLYNQICFAIAARHYPRVIDYPAPGS